MDAFEMAKLTAAHRLQHVSRAIRKLEDVEL
jgi:hypothetical protein